jgi:hypothetical protein
LVFVVDGPPIFGGHVPAAEQPEIMGVLGLQDVKLVQGLVVDDESFF